MDTVRIERFTSRIHAELACSMLVAHGFNARVSGDDVAGIHPDIPYGIGGTAIELPRTQVDEANALLDEEFAGGFDDDTLVDDAPAGAASLPAGGGAHADSSTGTGERRRGLKLFAAFAAATMLVIFASVTGTAAGWWG